jgi:hypothetical protein
MLYQSTFSQPHFPEVVELAVIGTGLGVLRSNLVFVKKVAAFWDSTHWQIAPPPFLNIQSLAYVNALAAWARDETTPAWLNDLNSEVKRPMKRSLKYLFKTGDTFFNPREAHNRINLPDEQQWWELAQHPSASTQVIAIRHVNTDQDLTQQQESVLLDKLQSTERATTLNAITTTERLSSRQENEISDSLTKQIRTLMHHRDDEIRAKAMCALTTVNRIDSSAIDAAASMIEDDIRHVVFAGVYALTTVDQLPDYISPSFDRSFIKALKSCDYEFVGLFAKGYNRWHDDPKQYLEQLLSDSPEFLPIAMEALDQIPQQVVNIG